MLKKPVDPIGKWIIDNDGLKIYDGIGVLIDHETDIEKAVKLSSILFNNTKPFNNGTQSKLKSEELINIMEQQWDYYNNHCTSCEKKLPKRFNIVNGKNLCNKCYSKEDTFINNKVIFT